MAWVKQSSILHWVEDLKKNQVGDHNKNIKNNAISYIEIGFVKFSCVSFRCIPLNFVGFR